MTLERTFENSMTRHGTNSGWSLHQKREEHPCDACVRAKREYDQRLRSAPEKARDNRLRARAQGRAYSDLKRLHPAEYRALYEAHLSELQREAKSDA